jgi:four helix bundle protein
MSTIEKFEDIESWKKARDLNKKIYQATSGEIFQKDLSLKDQIRRASNSIMLNIAEGFGRDSDKEFLTFLNYAHGSTAEVQSALYVAKDQKYIDEERFMELRQSYEELSRMIQGFMNYLSKQSEV